MKKFRSILILAMCAMLMLTMAVPAFAASGDVVITINPKPFTNTTDSGRFVAYQVFAGTVNEQDVANDYSQLSDITWGSGVDSAGLLAALKSDPDLGTIFTNTIAQETPKGRTEAEAVAKALDDNAKSMPDMAEKFTRIVAKYLQGSGTASVWNANSNNWTITVPQGYYLVKDTFVTPAEGDMEDAVSPYILDVFHNRAVDVKSAVPSVDKKVENGKGFVAGMSDTVTFQLTGTLPENFEMFTAYRLIFHDTMSPGLVFDPNSVQVAIDGMVVAQSVDSYTVTSDGGNGAETKIQIGFADLANGLLKDKQGGSIAVTHASKIVVTYTAKVDKTAVVGTEGNPNEVILEYSNDPYDSTGAKTGKTPPSEVKVYTLGLDITKQDGSTDNMAPVPNAKFVLGKLMNTASAENAFPAEGNQALLYPDASQGTYDDGVTPIWQYATLEAVNGKYKITGWTNELNKATSVLTSAAGKLYIDGLEDGYYVLIETAPTGYDTMKPIEFSVDTTVSDAGVLEQIDVTQAYDPAQGPRADATLSDETNDGIIEATFINYQSAILPHTGGMGNLILYILGAVAVLGGVTVIAVVRRKGLLK